MHEIPLDELVQPARRVAVTNQAGGVYLGKAAIADPVVEQGRVLGHKGVAFHVRQNRCVALRTDGVQRFINARLHRCRKLNQNIIGTGKGELAQIKAGQSRGVEHLGPQLGGQRQSLRPDGGGYLPEGGLALLYKFFNGDALIMKVRREHDTRRTVLQLLADERHRHIQIPGTVINPGQDVTVQINEGGTHSSEPCCLLS